jgi:hypothetical protein
MQQGVPTVIKGEAATLDDEPEELAMPSIIKLHCIMRCSDAGEGPTMDPETLPGI